MGADSSNAHHCTEPKLPAFLQHKPVPVAQLQIESDSFQSLLSDLCGELGFERQKTALRWLLEQLETSHDLRRLIHLLLQEGEA
jgi:hypothetical protein